MSSPTQEEGPSSQPWAFLTSQHHMLPEEYSPGLGTGFVGSAWPAEYSGAEAGLFAAHGSGVALQTHDAPGSLGSYSFS